MPRWSDAAIVGGSYNDDTRPFSVQDTVNFIPVYAEKEGTRSAKMLRCAPGFSVLADLGTNAPIRGARNVEGTFLAVSANKLFRIDTKGTPYVQGTIPGVSRVSMAHNQITGGNEVAISNGTSGYVYNTKTGNLSQITDEAFPGSISFAYCDSYILGIEPGRRFAFTSDLADATAYNSLDRYEAEGSPDALVGQGVSHRQWWLYGERSTEIYENAGTATGTFQRSSGATIEVGLASAHALAQLDNSLFWLGSDGVVYRANGYTPQRISTYPIEQAIAKSTMSSSFAFIYEDRGHKIFYLTFKDGHTWGYDVATQEWHRRQSKDLSRWRLNTLDLWNGMWIGGDYSNGRLYMLDWDVQSEAGVPMERRRITSVLSDQQNGIIVNAIELVIDTGEPVKDALAIGVSLSGDVPDGYVGQTVDLTYAPRGGTGPYTLSISQGSLPPGLAMNAQGHVTGTRTTEGAYAWTVKATDSKGVNGSFGDVAKVFTVLGAQLSGWKWLQTTIGDGTSYASPALDDSGWASGTAPFGNLTQNDGGIGIAAHVYEPRFKTTINTLSNLISRIWIRRHFNLQMVPPNGYKLIGYFDNSIVLYINGVKVLDGSTATAEGITQVIPASAFVVGDNLLAVRCEDGPLSIPNQGAYFDFLLDPV